MDDSFQPTIDMLLNVSVFIWFGNLSGSQSRRFTDPL